MYLHASCACSRLMCSARVGERTSTRPETMIPARRTTVWKTSSRNRVRSLEVKTVRVRRRKKTRSVSESSGKLPLKSFSTTQISH